MKFVIQRVNHAKVEIEGKISGEIQKGFLVFIGVGKNDTREIAEPLSEKMLGPGF